MKILVITNKIENSINTNLLHVFDAVRQLSGKCDVVVLGHQLDALATQISQYKVVTSVLKLDNIALENLLVENVAQQLSEIAKGYTHVLVAADSFGKNLLPRIAGVLELGQISEVTKIISPNIYQKFIYAGNVLIEVESVEDIKLLTIRTSNFTQDTQLADTQAPIYTIEFTNILTDKIKFISKDVEQKAVDLSSAKIVVTGGRSLGSADAFDTNIRALAKRLNAGVGATRAAVEAGYAHNDCQVGQTGKVVAPNLYLAFGVSGAVQHIAGMKDSRTVVAVNIDQTAPIFEHADYGIVADLFDVIPQLINKLN